MGLDMYAYAVRADLIKDRQIDIAPFDDALNEVGFKTLSETEYILLDNAQKSAYKAELNRAIKVAKERKLVNSEFAYWRKFNHLHGWMDLLYAKKSGTKEFNCTTVRLMPADLDRLEALASMKALAPTQGFFFGDYEPFDDEDRTEVLDFIKKARKAIEDGYAILYDSWW